MMGTLMCSSLSALAMAEGHQHHNKSVASSVHKSDVQCDKQQVTCAKTVTSAFTPSGELWRLWVDQQRMYYQISLDKGHTFKRVKKINIAPEKISARNENRPKLAFDGHQGVYLSWAKPLSKKYTADIRFAYSLDNGKLFSKPVTVNNDGLLAGHSFNEMSVNTKGDVKLVWLDGRYAYQQRQQGQKAKGSELYYANANPRQNAAQTKPLFSNEPLASGTCVCCRIAIDTNANDELAILWRHIYGDNIREFALMTLKQSSSSQLEHTKPIQISHDHWQINGCPHQGGGLSIDQDNNYHMVWFNLGDKGKGIFYAKSTDEGKTLSKPLAIGNVRQQAAHPHMLKNQHIVDIVWTEFNGKQHQLWHQRSFDHGTSFTSAKVLTSSNQGSDRPFIIKDKNDSYVSWHRPKQGHYFSLLGEKP